MRPGAPPQSRRYVCTGPGEVSSLVTDPPGTPVTPCKIRSFTSIQMVHTHTRPTAAGQMKWKWKWDDNENEMNITQPGREEGNAKEEGQREHQHDTPRPERANPEKAREKKSGGRRTTEQDQRRGGKDGSAWTNLTRRKPTPTSARAGPNLPKERRTQKHMRKGTHGGQVNKMMQPQRMQNSW